MPNNRNHPGIHQLLRHDLAGGGVGLVVHGHHFERDALAINRIIGLVQLTHGQIHAIEQILPQSGQGPAQRLRHPDLDGVRHIAAARQPSASGKGGKRKSRREMAPVQWLGHAENSVR